MREAVRVKVDIPAQVTGSRAGGEWPAVAASLANLRVTGALIQAEQQLGEVPDVIGVSFAFLAQLGKAELKRFRRLSAKRWAKWFFTDPVGNPSLICVAERDDN